MRHIVATLAACWISFAMPAASAEVQSVPPLSSAPLGPWAHPIPNATFPRSRDNHTYMDHLWLSPHRLLVIYKEKHPIDPNEAKIRVEVLDTRTGRHLQASSLGLASGLDNQPYEYHGNLIPWQLSPDHRWLLCAKRADRTHVVMGIGNAKRVVWERGDDTEKGDLYDVFWLPDSRRWICWNDGTADTDPQSGRTSSWVSLYTRGRQKPRIYHLRGMPGQTDLTGYTTIGVQPSGRIQIYRLTRTGHQVYLSLATFQLPAALVHRSHTVTLPADLDIDDASLSPSGDRLAWLCHGHNDHKAPESVWVSRADGEQFHRIGTEPLLNDPDPDLAEFDRSMIEICALRWQPGGTQLSIQSGDRIFSVAAW